MDIVLALLPVTFFWNLKLDPRKKIALSILMGLGVLYRRAYHDRNDTAYTSLVLESAPPSKSHICPSSVLDRTLPVSRQIDWLHLHG